MSEETPLSPEELKEKYPDALSRGQHNPKEGGFGLLHRVLAKFIETGEPVVINQKNEYYQFTLASGEDNNPTGFADGIILLHGDEEGKPFKNLMKTASKFDINIAIKEGGYKKKEDGKLYKPWLKTRKSI